ncbi:radial spoke head 10 homolog B-like isoform X2 [Convolutriloba macropyga]|uniref:radial spoke head 10 homolog B-like isoform X2 n=1 Tax=Convolutriloba macropyga TaxID=536237 RepID=UPI003F5287BF
MAKDKKKKKERQSAESQKSLGTERANTDSHEGDNDVSGVMNRDASLENPDNDNTLTNAPLEMTQSKVVDQKVFEEPVLAKLIVEEYNGEKELGLYHGLGEAKFVGGHFYKGDFFQGKLHGKGVYTWVDGVCYEGDFSFNQITGKGFYRWVDGSTYEGEVVNGLRHGSGTFNCPARGLCYTGQWYKGKRHGEGVLYYDSSQQSLYEGEWFLNMKNGRGFRRYASGNVYQGMWYRDRRHGYGRMQWLDNNNAVYEGDWENGLQHGYGEYTWFLRRLPESQYPQRNRYYGQWHRGVRQGMGTFIYANGSRYRGPWNNNLKHGPGGVITFRTGRVLQGEFKFDKMVDHPELDLEQSTTPEIDKLQTNRPTSASKGNFPDDVSIKSSGSVSGQSANQINFVLNVDSQLSTLPEKTREEEHQQIKFCVLRNVSLIRKIYAFYAKLCKDTVPIRAQASMGGGGGGAAGGLGVGGVSPSDDNTFVMEKLQFWQLLKDCRINEHEVTLIEIDRIIGASIELTVEGHSPVGGEENGDLTPMSPHQPNARMLFLDFVNALIYIAVYIFGKEAKDKNCQHVLASSLTMLLDQRLSKYACKVSGNFMVDPVRARITFDYLPKVYDIYSFLCKPLRVPPKHFPRDSTLCARDVLHMLSEYRLLNERLTTKAVMQILARQDSRIYDEEDCNLELELTLLEFMESLLSFATIFVTDEILKEPKRAAADQGKFAPQITFEPGSSAYPAHGRISMLTDEVAGDVDVGGVGGVPSKTAMVTPSQFSQVEGFADGEEGGGGGGALATGDRTATGGEDPVTATAPQTGGAQPITAGNNDSATERSKVDKKSAREVMDPASQVEEQAAGTGGDVNNGENVDGQRKETGAGGDPMQQSFKPNSGTGNNMAGVGAAGGDEPLFGSRPLTRGASNLTSARSSRYVDWGGDTEDEMEDLPMDVKLWVQQIKCFFDRKLLPAFHRSIQLQAGTPY